MSKVGLLTSTNALVCTAAKKELGLLMRNSTLVILVILMGLGCTGADGEPMAWWQLLLDNLLEIVAVLATPLLVLLARKGINLIEDKLNLDLDTKEEDMLLGWVNRGIAYAEEQAHKAIKDGSTAPSSDDKLSMAIDFITEAVQSMGLLDMGRDALVKLVEAELNQRR